MGGSKKKKKKTPEETPLGIDPDFPPPMDATSGGSVAESLSEATSGGSASEGIMDATSGGSASEGIGDATSGGSASEGLDDLLGSLGDESSPLIPDPEGGAGDEAALENEAKGKAVGKAQLSNSGRKGGGMSATAAKRKADAAKKKANKLAAAKAETAEKQQKEKVKRQRTIASQQNKTARERILRGETGARGRMFSRINAKFQIPDAPANFPRIGGSGTQYN